MTAPSITAAAVATRWVSDHRGELAAAATRAGMPPRDLDSAAWLAVLAAVASGEKVDEPRVARLIARRAAGEVSGGDLVARAHGCPRARRASKDVEHGACGFGSGSVTRSHHEVESPHHPNLPDRHTTTLLDLGLWDDPLACLIAAEDVAELVATSRWCADSARDATSAPYGRVPDPDPRGAKTRQRKRARERHGQLAFGGWGWQL